MERLEIDWNIYTRIYYLLNVKMKISGENVDYLLYSLEQRCLEEFFGMFEIFYIEVD